jgi:hypothetical protein
MSITLRRKPEEQCVQNDLDPTPLKKYNPNVEVGATEQVIFRFVLNFIVEQKA